MKNMERLKIVHEHGRKMPYDPAHGLYFRITKSEKVTTNAESKENMEKRAVRAINNPNMFRWAVVCVCVCVCVCLCLCLCVCVCMCVCVCVCLLIPARLSA
jgi:hypothetical protein